jgi:hypothetical protein
MLRPSRFLVLPTLAMTIGLVWASEAAAQRRAPAGGRTAPPGTPRQGVAVPRGAHPTPYRPYASRGYYYPRSYYSGYYPRYYYPYAYPRYYAPYYPYYSGFAFSFGFGWGWPGYYGAYGYPYGYPYGYAYAPAYPYYSSYGAGSVRLQVTPRNAQVYLDGRLVGLVDDFDGSFQRLNAEPGQHEVQIYLDGYRSFSQKVLFTPGNTVNLAGALQPLAPGDAPEARPQAPPPPVPQDRYEGERYAPPSNRAGEPGGFGTLSIRVNPSDAVILIDGETWDRPRGEDRFSIDLANGPHQIEVRKEGYRTYQRTVDVRAGRMFTLNVSLTAGGEPTRMEVRRGAALVLR